MTPEERIARLEVEVRHLCADVRELHKGVRELLGLVQRARGGWYGLTLALSLASAAGGLLTWLLSHLPIWQRM